MVGRYVHVTVGGTTYRTYFESNGEGIPLVCIHTAGGDSMQYRHLLADEALAKRYRVIAFDMPWHGRSLPPEGWWHTEYKLTRRFFLEFIIAFCEALDLVPSKTVLMGCSMGGYIMLDMAHEHPGRFGGLIALQPRAHETSWMATVKYLTQPEVNPNNFIRPMIRSLTASTSPETCRREVEWVYAKSGPGVLAGDFHLALDHDLREVLGNIDAKRCGLYVVGGDHDWSCTREHTRELADQIRNLTEIRIPDVGHFPPSEHPDAFMEAIAPVLAELEERLQGE